MRTASTSRTTAAAPASRRPVAQRQLDGHAAPVAGGGIDLDHVQDLRQFLAGCGGGLLLDVADAAVTPYLQQCPVQCVPVLEVPVEAALGDFQALGQHLHAQAGNAVFRQDGEGGVDPGVAIEAGAGRGGGRASGHTVAY